MSIDAMDFMGSGGNPNYFNRYAYTFNDPINKLDPDGNVVIDINIKGKSGGVLAVLGGSVAIDASFDTSTLELTGSGSVGGGLVIGKFSGGQVSGGQSTSAPINGIAQGDVKASVNGGVDVGLPTPKFLKKGISKLTGGKIDTLSASVSHEFASTSTSGETNGFNLPTVDSLVNSAQGGPGKGIAVSLTGDVSASGTVNFRNLASAAVERATESYEIIREQLRD